MITNKDIRVDNGNLVINGDKYPLDGQSPEAIMQIVEDNSDTTPTENSDVPVTSGGVYTALGNKQDTLTFDSAPTDESTNPVTSGGVFTALANKQSELVVTDITSSITVNTTIVDAFKAVTYGKLLYLNFRLKAGATDQSQVASDLPLIVGAPNETGVLPAFCMNGEDLGKDCMCALYKVSLTSVIQFRCSSAPTGSGGTIYSGIFILQS